MSTRARTFPTLGGAIAAVVTLAVVACGAPSTAAPATAASPPPTTSSGPTAGPATVATAASGTSAPTPGGSVTDCATAELRASVGPEEGAAGSVIAPLVLTNTGTRTCALRGFPGVSYVAGEDGQQIGQSAAMSGARGGEVVLAPGARAVAQLQLVNAADFDAAVCRPTPVRGLRVYPPGDTASLFVARPGTGCAGTPPGNQLSVQTLRAG